MKIINSLRAVIYHHAMLAKPAEVGYLYRRTQSSVCVMSVLLRIYRTTAGRFFSPNVNTFVLPVKSNVRTDNAIKKMRGVAFDLANEMCREQFWREETVRGTWPGKPRMG
ncbi:MAG: hypothetical protein N2117_08730 [Anaerolineales bacterium]|nr:hypothetical protein [Anaerolineales bacterium]MCX7755318.1 hypothetical protein [Anaerolineales bacterium]